MTTNLPSLPQLTRGRVAACFFQAQAGPIHYGGSYPCPDRLFPVEPVTWRLRKACAPSYVGREAAASTTPRFGVQKTPEQRPKKCRHAALLCGVNKRQSRKSSSCMCCSPSELLRTLRSSGSCSGSTVASCQSRAVRSASVGNDGCSAGKRLLPKRLLCRQGSGCLNHASTSGMLTGKWLLRSLEMWSDP